MTLSILGLLATESGASRENEALDALRVRFEALTSREKIMIQVALGRLSKQIAGDMGITEATAKVHRSDMMRKMRIASIAELCRLTRKILATSKQRLSAPN